MKPVASSFRATKNDILRWRNLCCPAMKDLPGWTYAGHRIDVQQLHPAYSPVGSKVALHRHSFYEGIIVLAGSARETSGNRQHLLPGTFLVNPPDVLHGWQAPDSDLFRLGIWFTVTPPLALEIANPYPQNPQMPLDVLELLQSVHLAAPGWRECFAARLLLLFATLLRTAQWPRKEQAVAGSAERLQIGALLCQFLWDNLSQPITLNDIAAHFGMSVPTLTRHLRQEGQTGAMAALHQFRMQRAAARLTTTLDSVRSIARQVGIPDPSYFNQCFHKHFGQSPQAYRSRFLTQDRPGQKRD